MTYVYEAIYRASCALVWLWGAPRHFREDLRLYCHLRAEQDAREVEHRAMGEVAAYRRAAGGSRGGTSARRCRDGQGGAAASGVPPRYGGQGRRDVPCPPLLRDTAGGDAVSDPLAGAVVYVPMHRRCGVIREALGEDRYQVHLLTHDGEFGAFTDLPRAWFVVLVLQQEATR